MKKQCLNCERSEKEIPLIALAYREKTYYVCPQCLPVLIHEPQNLAGKLPGADKFPPVSHNH